MPPAACRLLDATCSHAGVFAPHSDCACPCTELCSLGSLLVAQPKCIFCIRAHTAPLHRLHCHPPPSFLRPSLLQVAVLGLPWEYTHADVRALLEAAAEAEGTQPSEAGVQHVEVAYREDGKSEVGAWGLVGDSLLATATLLRESACGSVLT